LPSISSDGRYVLFYSQASNLIPPSGIGGENLYVRDRVLGTNYSLTHGGAVSASMTPDGHYVAFIGTLGSSGLRYAYVWDTQAAALVYTNTSFSTGGWVYVSPSGRLLAWNTGSLTIWDRIARTSQSAGTIYPGRNTGFKFSADERYLVYSTCVAKVAGDTNGIEDIYLYDLQAATHTLISQSTNAGFAANGVSLFPEISADGRFVVYASLATDLSPSDGNAAKDIFLFDRQAGTTTLLSASAYGTHSAAGISTVPVFGGDGRTVLFQSSAIDLVDQGFRQGANAFLLRLPSSNPVFPGQIIYVPGSLQLPMIRWLAPPGKSYQVEFKNELADTVWQPLNATVSIADGVGQATDPAPAPAHRFYRIVAN
jgi:Tol biopolymer transport system component